MNQVVSAYKAIASSLLTRDDITNNSRIELQKVVDLAEPTLRDIGGLYVDFTRLVGEYDLRCCLVIRFVLNDTWDSSILQCKVDWSLLGNVSLEIALELAEAFMWFLNDIVGIGNSLCKQYNEPIPNTD